MLLSKRGVLGCALILGMLHGRTPAEVIGSPLLSRVITDTDAGQVYVYVGITHPFTVTGQTTSWSFFDDRNSGRSITPLIFRIDGGGNYSLTGVGATRTSAATGGQSFPLDLIAGSSAVAAGQYTFGFTDRAYSVQTGTLTPGAANPGVISFDGPRNFTDRWLVTAVTDTGGPVPLQIGSVLGPGGTSFYADTNFNGRIYSAQMTAVPEPAAVALASAASLLLARRTRRP